MAYRLKTPKVSYLSHGDKKRVNNGLLKQIWGRRLPPSRPPGEVLSALKTGSKGGRAKQYQSVGWEKTVTAITANGGYYESPNLDRESLVSALWLARSELELLQVV